MNLGLDKRTALVTGASEGIGKAIALALLAEGARVSIVARRPEGLAQLHDALAPFGDRAITIAADVTKEDDVVRMVDETTRRLGPVDILVNNAGTGAFKAFEELSLGDWRELFEINLFSVVAMTRAVLPSMRERHWGRIINVSSESGIQPDPVGTHYNTSKGALNTLTKSLSKAYGADNILINTISPAFIMTPLLEGMMEKLAKQRGVSRDEAVTLFLKEQRMHIELKRPGTPEECAAAVCFLASDQASFITGANLRVDGGSVATVEN